MSETTFFQEQDVLVTNSRVVVAGKSAATAGEAATTYPVSDIVSAALRPDAGKAVAVVTRAFTLSAVAAAASFLALWYWKGTGHLPFVAGFAICVLGTGTTLGLLLSTFLREYKVVLTTPAGERKALIGRDRAYLSRVAAAVNQAVAARGAPTASRTGP